MIALEITGVHFALDDKTKQHVTQKIGHLDRYLGRKIHGPITGHVVLTETKGNPQQRYGCEVTLATPGRRLVAKEVTSNTMFAAVDQAESKLKAQLTKYKSRREAYQHRLRSVIRRFRRSQ